MTQTTTADGRFRLVTQVGNLLVSTVALPFDHSFGAGKPQEFETMVFACDDAGAVTDWTELYCDRYATQDEAEAKHDWVTEAAMRGEIGGAS